MKPAPAVVRAAEVLNYLTVNPRSGFTQSELSRATDVSPASMASILLALTEAGFLLRHPNHKTFELGPALVALGYAASITHPVVELARPVMGELAALGTECIGSAVVGNEIVNLAVEGRVSARTRELRIGQRIPLVPPYGHVFLAWSAPARVSHWVARLGTSEASQRRAGLERSLQFVRDSGFAVALDNDKVTAVQRLVQQTADQPGNSAIHDELIRLIPEQAEDYILTSIDADRDYLVNNIAAPVFGPGAAVIYALTIHGIGRKTGAEVLEIGQHLGDICRTLTRELGGRAPQQEGRR